VDAGANHASVTLSSYLWLELAGLLCALPHRSVHARHRVRRAGRRQPPLPLLAGLGAGIGTMVLAGGSGIVLAPVVATVVAFALRRLSAADVLVQPDLRSVALILDLIASALVGGSPPDHAIGTVAAAAEVGQIPELHDAMVPIKRVGRLLSLGAEPAAAWSELAAAAGYGQAAAAGRRCAGSGSRLAGALHAAGAELRQQRHSAALTRAERIGVWSLLPLGFCFLPAFLCIGVAPVVVGVAGKVLSGVPS
jgi:pilus assembly protein TadC